MQFVVFIHRKISILPSPTVIILPSAPSKPTVLGLIWKASKPDMAKTRSVIHPETKYPSSCQPGKLSCASKLHWRARHRTDTPVSKWRHQEKRGAGLECNQSLVNQIPLAFQTAKQSSAGGCLPFTGRMVLILGPTRATILSCWLSQIGVTLLKTQKILFHGLNRKLSLKNKPMASVTSKLFWNELSSLPKG